MLSLAWRRNLNVRLSIYSCGSIFLFKENSAVQFNYWNDDLETSWRRSLSYRNQSIDLFPYDRDLHHESKKRDGGILLTFHVIFLLEMKIIFSYCLKYKSNFSKFDEKTGSQLGAGFNHWRKTSQKTFPCDK